MRFVESTLAGVATVLLTQSFVLGAVIVFVLYVIWEGGRYGRFSEIDRKLRKERKGKVDTDDREREDPSQEAD
jgi:hypothetical protein